MRAYGMLRVFCILMSVAFLWELRYSIPCFLLL